MPGDDSVVETPPDGAETDLYDDPQDDPELFRFYAVMVRGMKRANVRFRISKKGRLMIQPSTPVDIRFAEGKLVWEWMKCCFAEMAAVEDRIRQYMQVGKIIPEPEL